MDDLSHMRAALALARRGLGNAWPNPAVGCVVVRDGRVVGRAGTAPGGRPHAEPLALAMAGAGGARRHRLRHAGALLPPRPHAALHRCADRRRRRPRRGRHARSRPAGERRGHRPAARRRHRGRGRAAGRARPRRSTPASSAGCARGRPLVTLKLASTLDGRIATRAGESQWITGEPARRMAHALRGRHDAVMVGVGTVLADDPDLTCRIPGYQATSPGARGGRQPPAHAADQPAGGHRGARRRPGCSPAPAPTPTAARALEAAGVEVIDGAARGTPGVDLPAALAALGRARHHPRAGRRRRAARRRAAARRPGGPHRLVPRARR